MAVLVVAARFAGGSSVAAPSLRGNPFEVMSCLFLCVVGGDCPQPADTWANGREEGDDAIVDEFAVA